MTLLKVKRKLDTDTQPPEILIFQMHKKQCRTIFSHSSTITEEVQEDSKKENILKAEDLFNSLDNITEKEERVISLPTNLYQQFSSLETEEKEKQFIYDYYEVVNEELEAEQQSYNYDKSAVVFEYDPYLNEFVPKELQELTESIYSDDSNDENYYKNDYPDELSFDSSSYCSDSNADYSSSDDLVY